MYTHEVSPIIHIGPYWKAGHLESPTFSIYLRKGLFGITWSPACSWLSGPGTACSDFLKLFSLTLPLGCCATEERHQLRTAGEALMSGSPGHWLCLFLLLTRVLSACRPGVPGCLAAGLQTWLHLQQEYLPLIWFPGLTSYLVSTILTSTWSLQPQAMASISCVPGPGSVIYRFLVFEFSLDPIISMEISLLIWCQ